jgi:ketosteroid isomerase-like protein
MSNPNKTVVEEINAAFARGDVEGVLRHCSDDIAWTMVGEKPLRGKDAIREMMAQGPQDPPDFTVRTIVADGDVVVATGDMTMEEGGATVPYAFCDVWRFRGGTAVSIDAFVIRTDRVERAATAGQRRP